MGKIKNFNNRNASHENHNNTQPESSVFDSLPEVILWESDDKAYSIKNQGKIVSKLLEKENLIAIIEAPFDVHINKAYIMNGRSEVVMDVAKSVKEKYNHFCNNRAVAFVDLYYMGGKLFYFLVINNSDFRIDIDTNSFTPGDLIESR